MIKFLDVVKRYSGARISSEVKAGLSKAVANSVFAKPKAAKFFDFSDFTKKDADAKLLKISEYLASSVKSYNTSSVKLLGLECAKEHFGAKWKRYEPVVDRIVRDSIDNFTNAQDIIIRARKTKYMIIFCNLTSSEADQKLAEISECIAELLFNEDPLFEHVKISAVSETATQKPTPEIYSSLSKGLDDDAKVYQIKAPPKGDIEPQSHAPDADITHKEDVLGMGDILGCSSRQVVGELLYDRTKLLLGQVSLLQNIRALHRTLSAADLMSFHCSKLENFIMGAELGDITPPQRILLPFTLGAVMDADFHKTLSPLIFEVAKLTEIAILVMDVPLACPEDALEKVADLLGQYTQHIVYEVDEVNEVLLEKLMRAGNARGVALDVSMLKSWDDSEYSPLSTRMESGERKMCNIAFGMGRANTPENLVIKNLISAGFNLYCND